jgi:hypothetical protein
LFSSKINIDFLRFYGEQIGPFKHYKGSAVEKSVQRHHRFVVRWRLLSLGIWTKGYVGVHSHFMDQHLTEHFPPSPDRRSFLAISTAATLPAISLSTDPNCSPWHFPFNRFVSFDKHVEKVGKTQALDDSRNELFPVTLDSVFSVGE